MSKFKNNIVATFLVVSGLICIIQILVHHRQGRDPNPFSDVSVNSLATTIEQFVARQGWLVVPQPEADRLASEARAYEKKDLGDAARVIVIRTDSSNVIVWIAEQNGVATVAHVRIYGDYDLGIENLFAVLRPLVPYSSAGGPPLASEEGEQAAPDRPLPAAKFR